MCGGGEGQWQRGVLKGVGGDRHGISHGTLPQMPTLPNRLPRLQSHLHDLT